MLNFHFEGEHLLVEPIPRRHLLDFRGRFPVPQALDHDMERALGWAERAQDLTEPRPDEESSPSVAPGTVSRAT